MRDACLDAIARLLDADGRVCYVGSDLGPTTMLDARGRHPDRCLMEGVSEQHLVAMAVGMALEGMVVYVNTIATFLTRRCFEQVALACMHGANIRLIGNGGGLVYAPLGPTHLAIDDIALMRILPDMTVVCPSTRAEMVGFVMDSADHPGPIYFRVGVGE